MSGLLLIGVFGIWIAIVFFLMKGLRRLLKPGVVRVVAITTASAALLVLPVADELISAPQFNKLCEKEAILKFDAEKIRGKTIIYEKSSTSNPRFSVGPLNGYYIHRRYLDATTREEVISGNSYYLKGGILIRTLRISETNAPLTIRSYCGPSEHPTQKSFLNRYNLNYLGPVNN